MSKDYSYTSIPFLNEIMSLSADITWKNRAKALEGESDVDAIDVDQYLAAKKGLLTFDSIYSFSEEVLESVGFTTTQITNILDDKYDIPVSLRDTVSTLQIAYILENYEELNNYYRMLYGLPDTDDVDYIYNTDYPELSSTTIPIHKLALQERYNLENAGVLDTLYEANPTKKYIRHLTSRNISPYTSREAERFEILYIPSSTFVNLQRDFVDVYNEVSVAIQDTFYNDAMRKNNSQYEGFIAMCILFMSIQKMFTKYLECDLTREFYDVESLRLIYDSYGVPFYSSIPIEYHRKIVKNVNQLLSNKGSTKVLYQLFEIFDFGLMEIFEYYILKIHKFENGKPVFVYNTDGSYNYKEMYDIKFGKVQLYNDPPMELSQTGNHLDYEDFIANDPYWVNDDELLDKLYSEEYNYLESKYIGVQTLFNLMKIMYESTFYFNTIINNRETLEGSTVYMNAIGDDIDIFELVIYLACLICRKHGYDGFISSKLSTISKVRGFDFTRTIHTIIQSVEENKTLAKDETLISYLTGIVIGNIDTLNTSYDQIVDLRNYLGKMIADTHDPTVYSAYRELYDDLMYSEYVTNVFSKQDGTVATTFEDLLDDINSNLYTRLISGIDYASEISSMLVLFKNSCTSLSQIQFSDGSSLSPVLEYLFKIMDFFKSSKSDLTGYSIIYTLSSNTNNILKLMAELKLQEYSQNFNDQLADLTDNLDSINFGIKMNDPDAAITFNDMIINTSKYQINENLPYIDILKDYILNFSEPIESDLLFTDIARINLRKSSLAGSTMALSDSLTLISTSTEE